MYGKIFQRMYQGSMVGAGADVFAIWGYCISNADAENHTVDLNPKLLSVIIGMEEYRVENAILYLTKPDDDSHNKDHEGRRLLHTSGFEYFVVSHEQYRDMKNNEELRAYFRENKRKQRMSKNVLDSIRQSQDPVSVSVSASVSESSLSSDFERFWTSYPRKTGKKAALKAWLQAKDKPPISDILKTIEALKLTDQWRKDGGQFIPMPATWLNQGRWTDEGIKIERMDSFAKFRTTNRTEC